MLDALAVSVHLHDGIADHRAIERCGDGPGSYAAKEDRNDQPASEGHMPDRVARAFIAGADFSDGRNGAEAHLPIGRIQNSHGSFLAGRTLNRMHRHGTRQT